MYYIANWIRPAAYPSQMLLNSLVGYLFMRFLAYHFGTSENMSSFEIAFSLPFIIMNMSGFTFLYAVFASTFAKMLAVNSDQVNSAFSSLFNLLILISCSLIVVSAVFSDQLVHLMAPGLTSIIKEQTKMLMLIMLPLVIPYGTSTYFGGIFTAYGLPIPPEFVLLFSRLAFLIFAVLFTPNLTLAQIAISLLIFSIITLFVEWSILQRTTGLRYQPILSMNIPQLVAIRGQALGFLAVALMAQLNFTYQRSLATFDGPGTVAALSYGYAVVIPLGVLLGKCLAFALGPKYMRLYEQQAYEVALRMVLRYTFVSIAITVALVLVINANLDFVIQLMYAGGNFNDISIVETASVTKVIMWSVPSAALQWVVLFPLLSRSGSQAAPVIYIIGYTTQILLNWAFFWSFGKEVLTWGYSFSMVLQSILGVGYVYIMLRRQIKDGKSFTS